MKNQKKTKSGFTLLELLVVISIIGILLALGSVAYSTAQRRGRDAKRRADMKATQSGFEQYYSSYGNYGSCGDMGIDEFFPGGSPQEVRPNHLAYQCSADVNGYCVCARLESGGGNGGNNPCPGRALPSAYQNLDGDDIYCLTNLQ